ncbi:MAG: CPBP family intramembrane glutamic endopeptidase [Verrucomicrobiota bacterium]|jgi:membrane protease YdiL (CAAX protease family)
MRPIRALLVYFAVVFIGGALLAPWLFWLAQWLAGLSPALSALAAHPFHRFVDRSLLGVALLGLWPLLRHCGLRGWAGIGFATGGHAPAEILRGFSLGWASLACAALLAFLGGVGASAGSHSAAQLSVALLGAALTAVIVGVLEEMLFRGALFGILRDAMPWPAALAVSSAVYSLAHFIRSPQSGASVHWYSGLALLQEMFRHPPGLIPASLTLFVAGAILALAYQRSGALYFSIGLHAGWIFWLKSWRLFFHQDGPGKTFWGTDNLLDGWLAFLILLGVFCIVARRRPLNPKRHLTGAH